MATHLYRIAQEAVTNACKHGAAKRIEIALSFTDGNVVLSVSDNGREMKKAPGRKGGLGLRIMNYRAETLGGSLVFENRPGGGKNVICTVPNDPAASTKN